MLRASIPLIRAKFQPNAIVCSQIGPLKKFSQFMPMRQAIPDPVELGVLLVLLVPNVNVHHAIRSQVLLDSLPVRLAQHGDSLSHVLHRQVSINVAKAKLRIKALLSPDSGGSRHCDVTCNLWKQLQLLH